MFYLNRHSKEYGLKMDWGFALITLYRVNGKTL